jgi:hypothetical protein
MNLPGEYEQARAMAEALLHLHASPDKELFDGIIAKAARDLSVSERDRLSRELETKFSVFVPESQMLTDNTDHVEWLLNARSEVSWTFWERYREYLQHEKRMQPAVLKSIHELTDDILGHLENPKRPGTWDRRGVVAGQVQSGKTANYTGLICKAADAGYKLIIVLAGMHNSLRSQTQLRLDEGFLGRDTNQYRIFHTDSPKIGVGRLPGDCPDAIPLTTSHEMGDFKKRTAESMSLPTSTIPFILIVKKNAGILRNLLSWIQNNLAEKRGDSKIVPGRIPLLLLDDEADNASINTKKLKKDQAGNFEEEQVLARINSLIRRILNTFERKAYIGYTATPFANIFIPHAATRDEGKDLFPESFIVNLRPPSNYIGPVQVFGLDSMDSDGNDGMPIVRHIHDAETVFPAGHKIDHADSITALPPSLEEAIRAFILVCAARRCRGQVNAHNSMLVHVTRYVKVQGAVVRLVVDVLEDLQRRIRNGDGARTPRLMDELKDIWERDFVPTTESVRTEFLQDDATLTPLTWEQVEPHLFPAAEKIKVKEMNGHAADTLEYYDNQAHGLSVIAVGGDKLSRGLTLEGLSISYYLRTTYMYDTLMQMGRWFGYRTGYADLCRLYTTPELEDWYRHITMASEELRNEFDAMARLRLTPKDFGLKVQMHPGALMVTSADKARYGQKIRMSYMGQLVESYCLAKDAEILDQNRSAAEDLLNKLDRYTTPEFIGDPEKSEMPRALVWRAVRPSHVAEFLSSLRGAPDTRGRAPAHASVPARQAEFIRKKVQQRSELTEWTVALCSSTTGTPSVLAGHPIGLIQRTPADGSRPEDPIYYIRKNHIIDPGHEALDLTDEERQKALEDHQQTKPDAKAPNGISARKIRPRNRGLLLLYPLDPGIQKQNKKGELITLFPEGDVRRNSLKPVIGFALSFPGFGSRDYAEDAIEYLANTIFIENELQEDGLDEEEEGDEDND